MAKTSFKSCDFKRTMAILDKICTQIPNAQIFHVLLRKMGYIVGQDGTLLRQRGPGHHKQKQQMVQT